MKNPIFSALRVAGLLLFCLAAINGHTTTYYFSTTDGDDARSFAQAQNPASPWKSLAKLAAIFSTLQPGDSVLFKRGGVFFGSISPTASGNASSPIVLAAYGSGDKPVISGFAIFTNWSAKGGRIWEADASAAGESLNMVVVNGSFAAIGRYPNASTANGGYLTVDSYSGNSSITGNGLSSAPNCSGGDVVIRKNRWILDRNKILSQSGNTISYASESGYYATTGYGYFLQNHPATLDQDGEWYFQSKRLGVYLASGSPSSAEIKGSMVPVLVSLANQSNLRFSGLAFEGANDNAVEIRNAQNISFVDCALRFSGVNAVDAANVEGLSIQASQIAYTNNVALNLEGCSGTVLQNNSLSYTGAVAGMGKGGDGTYSAILLNGDNNSIEGNTIENTGYVPVSFNGSNVRIKNNFISGYTLVKDDGGGIYTWNNGVNAPTYSNRTVSGNIILNGHSASAGTNDASPKFSHGIYIDDNAANVEMSGNTVANCEGFGFYIHNARQCSLQSNTAYNNTVQLAMVEDEIAPNSYIRNCDVRKNIFFSLQAEQTVAEYKSRANDLADFGSFDENYYSRPFDDNAVIGTLRNNGSYVYQAVDLDGWKAMYGKDAGSKSSPKTFSPFRINNFLTGNKYGNGAFDANAGGLYAFSPANNCQTSWNNGALDGGTLAVGFSSITNNSKGTVVIGVGALTAGKKYLLRFSLKGGGENKVLETYLRKSGAPYNDVTDRKLVTVKPNRKEVQLLFTTTESTGDGSIGLDVPEQSSPVYFDNIDLREVAATEVDPTDSVKFVYNATASTTQTTLSLGYIDVKGTVYNGSATTAPWSSLVLLASSGTPPPPPPQVACSGTGTILREQWDDVNGNDVAQIPVTLQPSSSGQVTSFEGPVDSDNKYGSRVRGYICPPQTGAYTFFIAGDDATELWLSTNDDPSVKKKIAYNLNWTSFREWTKYASQKSAPVVLEAGKKYYIEALHKEGAGGDHLSVAWQLPDGSMEAPIAGSRLSPFVPAPLADQTITFPSLQPVTLGNGAIMLNATASSGLPVSYSIVSGSAILNGNQATPTAAGVVIVKAAQAGNAQYNAAADVQQTVTVLPAVVSSCTATGSILREQWDGAGGNDIAQIPLSQQATSSAQLTAFEGPQNAADNYGSRIRGYLCVPQSGSYTFYIAGDDATELWLSSDASPSNKTKLAYSFSWTGFREWTRYASQKSTAISLEAGKKYYIEALQKEGAGGDHLSVAMQMPNGSFEGPIAGNRLSPYVPVPSTSQCSAMGLILREQWNNVNGNDVAQIPVFTAPFSSTRISSFEGPVDIDNKYGSRIRGYICPPQTGAYTFYIAGDDATELWLSTNNNPGLKTKIAYNLSWTGFREWDKYASQKSAPVMLEAGKKYYIEALHKEGAGGDHLSVAWQLPDGSMEAPISGNRLSPFVESIEGLRKTAAAPVEVQIPSTTEDPVLSAFPNPFVNKTRIQLNPAETGTAKVVLMDAAGRVQKVLFAGTLQKHTVHQLVLDGSGLPSGLYLVRYVWRNGSAVIKLNKQ